MRISTAQEALWRLDEVLEAAMAGVRLGDGTTWVKHRGYAWVLGAHMAAKLYPAGGCTAGCCRVPTVCGPRVLGARMAAKLYPAGGLCRRSVLGKLLCAAWLPAAEGSRLRVAPSRAETHAPGLRRTRSLAPPS